MITSFVKTEKNAACIPCWFLYAQQGLQGWYPKRRKRYPIKIFLVF